MGIWVIGAYKLAKALLLLAAGVAFLCLPGREVAEGLERLAARLRLDPEDGFVHTAIARLAGLDRRHLNEIGAGTFLYGLLYIAQSVGLLLRRRWGSYLVIVTTGFLIPFECYEVMRKVDATRLTVLALNLGIVAYLIALYRRAPK